MEDFKPLFKDLWDLLSSHIKPKGETLSLEDWGNLIADANPIYEKYGKVGEEMLAAVLNYLVRRANFGEEVTNG